MTCNMRRIFPTAGLLPVARNSLLEISPLHLLQLSHILFSPYCQHYCHLVVYPQCMPSERGHFVEHRNPRLPKQSNMRTRRNAAH